MSFIKKYSILLIPVGIALVAGVFIALTMLTSGSLAEEIKTNSEDVNRKVDSLSRRPVPKGQADVERQRQDKIAKMAENVEMLARQGTMRELMSYRIFVEQRDRSQQLYDEYGKRYRAAIEGLVRSMKALSAPSALEIQKEVGAAAGNVASRPTGYGGSGRGDYGGGDYYSRPVISTSRSRDQGAQKAMLDAVCSKRAEEILVYANPNLFKWYQYWGDFQFLGEESAVKDCWYSQVAYWIYEDVVATINKMNEGSENVFSSPVKRLVGVSFRKAVDYQDTRQPGARGYGYGGGYSMRGDYDDLEVRGDAPDYIFDKMGGVLGVEPWTARICDDDIDVVHFSMGVLTSSSSVMSLMRELCSIKEHKHRTGYAEDGAEQTFNRNQITILKSEVIPVDLKAKEHEHYRYGNEAVVRVDLVCEYIFHRSAYDDIKPESIKKALRQSESEDGSTTTTPGAGSTGRGGVMPPASRRGAGGRRDFDL